MNLQEMRLMALFLASKGIPTHVAVALINHIQLAIYHPQLLPQIGIDPNVL